MGGYSWNPGMIIRFLEIATEKTVWASTDQWFLDRDLIRHDGEMEQYIATPRGVYLIEMWTKTPLPVQVWVDPRLENK